jgi:phthiodiolone/phenolphthiodiolone dimycocerosates ketoreductase
MMGAVGSHTERLKLGVVVTDLIRRHPAVAAEMMLTVDHLCRGRAIFGLGSGEAMNVTPYGMDFSSPVGKLAEGLQVLRLLWRADGPVSFEGKYFQLKNAVLGLRPYRDVEPQVWTAAHGPKMLRITGEQADGWLPTKLERATYRDSLETIRVAGRDCGRDMDLFTPGILAYVLAAPDQATLERLRQQPLIRALMVMLPPEIFRRLGLEPPVEGFHGIIPAEIERSEALRIIDSIPPKVVDYYCFCGTPEQIAEQIAEYHAVGLRHVIMWNITAFGDPSLAGWSFKALQQIKEHLRNR